MKLLFLDIDGVLNNHTPLESGYNGICQHRARLLNIILESVPDLQIVVSSAWRYMILEGAMTLKGFAHLLAIHGIKSHGRMHGHTEADVHPDNQPPHSDRDDGTRWVCGSGPSKSIGMSLSTNPINGRSLMIFRWRSRTCFRLKMRLV